MSSPTQRTLERLRNEGWQVAVVEKWLKHPTMKFGRRIDVWNFADILACRPGDERLPAVTALVQVTSGSHHADHRDKLLGRITPDMDEKQIAEAKKIAAAVKIWKACGNVVWLISWTKKGKNWVAKEEQI